jgi:drug/metabolite transporter (DMT)-like permease
MTAIIGGLIAAVLWATATLCSSRTSRMLGSRVVIAWVMLIGIIIGAPLAVLDPLPPDVEPSTYGLLGVAGVCYAFGLLLAYIALTRGKVSIVAPIVATEGAIAAVIAIAFGDAVGVASGVALAVIAIGVVLSSVERARGDVPAGDLDLVPEALAGPEASEPLPPTATPATEGDVGRSAIYAIAAALIFGVGLFASGRAAAFVPAIWVAFAARIVGVALITIPIAVTGQLRLTRAALPLLLVAGAGEILGSTASAWGAKESIPIVAVMGSQFAAIAAVAAFFLFGERLARPQVLGVVLIIVGVTALAAIQG